MAKACVIGWPVKHSRSPLIHGFWLKKYAIAGAYEKRAVEPGDLENFLETLEAKGFNGCNVTIPHKEAVFNRVIVTDEVTQGIGAVNTVYVSKGKTYGLNTDGYGFLANLKNSITWQSENKTVSIIGAGGAARAIIATLIKDGVKVIYLFNRTTAKAQILVKEFGSVVKAKPLENLEKFLDQTDLLINTTSLGMVGQPPLQISLQNLPSGSSVADIVYDPLETNLLKQARANAHRTVDGLGMLLHQAVPGFEKWFGIRPQVTKELRDLVVADLLKDKPE